MPYNQIPLEVRLHPDFDKKILPQIRAGKLDTNGNDLNKLIEENKKFYERIDFRDIVSRIQALTNDLRRHVINREEISQQSIRAMITGEHQFIFSAAGVAKSLFANQLFSYIRDCNVYSIQFSPDTTPDDLFGGYDLERFKKGEVYHNIEGSILTNNFAFLDEFMDANDKILRTLLGVLLERRFINGNQEEAALLHTAIATSNYMRRSETTSALLDRFLYKAFISPKKDMFTLLQIDHVYNDNSGQVATPSENMRIEMRELVYLRNLVQNRVAGNEILIPPEIEYLKNLVAATYETEMKKYREKFYLSPRTITKSIDLIKTNALLRGDEIANIEDIRNLHYLFSVLHEPLDEEKNFTSEELFSRVVQKRIQYFNSIKEEITPMLYLIDYLHSAERDPGLLKQPLTFLQKTASRSLLKDLVEKIRKAFNGRDETGIRENLDKILGYLETFRSQYAEINEFRERTINYTKRVFKEN